jgi:phosphatidylinositol-3-phosphatase
MVTRLCTILLALALAGCGGAAATTGASPASSTRGERAIRHVVWILMENKSTDVVDSPGAPYLSHLARTYGYATDDRAIAHPSLPNYIALTSGATHGVTHDWSPGAPPGEPMTYSLDVPSIFSQLPGGRSRSLAESMPANCERINHFPYLSRHNPELYYTNLGSDCLSYDVPFGPTPDLTAAFTFVAPNAIDDMHNGTIQEGNRFLAAYIPKLLATPQYQSGTTVIFITWDESESDTGVNDVPLIVISPYTHGVVDHHLYSHYSLLRTTEQLLGLPLLGNARTAPSLLGRFGF